ncbi:MAG: hypothetical protein ABSC10_08515 [Candidatus Acidiferrales bacterium]|jgi:hypothetical protein
MTRFSVFACTIALACGATVLLAAGTVRRSQILGDQVDVRMGAAFRDGLFLGRRDAESGRRRHLSSGRWSDDADRRFFVSGYLQGYREMYGQVASEEFLASMTDQHSGYRDGLADGLKDRQQSIPFRASATENYKHADRLYSADEGDSNQLQQFYRAAYCDGYQQAYYAEQ